MDAADLIGPQGSSRVSINDLPDDLLLLILEESAQDLLVPLEDTPLIAYVEKAFVCSRWLAIIQQLLQSRQVGSVPLKLFECSVNVQSYRELLWKTGLYQQSEMPLTKVDHLFLRNLAGQPLATIRHVLENLLPELTKLTVYTLNLDHCLLFQTWPDLTSITLVELPFSKSLQEQLWATLNALPQLVDVHLLKSDCMLPPQDEEELTFLKHLSQFTLHEYLGDYVPLLRQLGPSCRRLSCGPFKRDDSAFSMFDELTQENAKMLSNLTHLSIRVKKYAKREPKLASKMLKLITSHCKSLTYLDCEFAVSLSLSLANLKKFTRELSRLPSLSEIRIRPASYLFHHIDPTAITALPTIRTLNIVNTAAIHPISLREQHLLGHVDHRGPLPIFPDLEAINLISRGRGRGAHSRCALRNLLCRTVPEQVLRQSVRLLASEADFVPEAMPLEPLNVNVPQQINVILEFRPFFHLGFNFQQVEDREEPPIEPAGNVHVRHRFIRQDLVMQNAFRRRAAVRQRPEHPDRQQQ